MIEHLLAVYQLLLDYAKPWPAAQAAIVTTSSLVFTGGIGFILWKLPNRVMHFVRTQCMTKLSFSTASTNWSEYNSRQYIAFLAWFAKNSWFNWSRVITLDGNGGKGSVGQAWEHTSSSTSVGSISSPSQKTKPISLTSLSTVLAYRR